MDTVSKLKSELFAELHIQYKNLITSLRAMPINDVFKNPGFQNLDQGMMWFEKGIHNIQVETAVPQSSPDSQKPVINDDGSCNACEEKSETIQ